MLPARHQCAFFEKSRTARQTPKRINSHVMLLKYSGGILLSIEPPKTIVPDLKGGLHPARLFTPTIGDIYRNTNQLAQPVQPR
jgi:hypothetical protein